MERAANITFFEINGVCDFPDLILGHNMYFQDCSAMSTAIEIYELSAGYWPHSCCIHVFMDQDGVEVHKLAEKQQVQYPAILTKQAWPIKDLLYLVSCYRCFFVSWKNIKNS